MLNTHKVLIWHGHVLLPGAHPCLPARPWHCYHTVTFLVVPRCAWAVLLNLPVSLQCEASTLHATQELLSYKTFLACNNDLARLHRFHGHLKAWYERQLGGSSPRHIDDSVDIGGVDGPKSHWRCRCEILVSIFLQQADACCSAPESRREYFKKH